MGVWLCSKRAFSDATLFTNYRCRKEDHDVWRCRVKSAIYIMAISVLLGPGKAVAVLDT